MQNETKHKMFYKKTVKADFDAVVEKVKTECDRVGFGVITEIDMDKKLQEKLNVQVKPYKILGVCNPGFAYKALQANTDIGVFLPCKVVVKQLDEGEVEVVTSNMAMLMSSLDNADLNEISEEVFQKMSSAIDNV